MGFMQKFEQKIELIVGDTLALVFGGKVQLQEVTFAMRRQAREGTVRLSNGRYLTPSRYTVYISPEDRSGILERANISLQLAADLEHFIQDNSWSVEEPVIIFIQANSALRSGQFRVQYQSSQAQHSETLPAKNVALNGDKKNSHNLIESYVISDTEYNNSYNGTSHYEQEFQVESNNDFSEIVLDNMQPVPTKTEASFRDSPRFSTANGSSQRREAVKAKKEISYPVVQHGVRNNGEYINTSDPEDDLPSPLNSIHAVELIDNSDPSQIYELTLGVTILGRGQDADLRILDSGISRKHVQITYTPELVEISDLGSTNGTTVNHENIEKRELKDGDLISLGHSEFIVRIFTED